MAALTSWTTTTLGRTGLQVGRLGMAGGYGVPTASVERAFERGVNYFYHGSIRRGKFAQALRNIAPKRDQFTLVIQSYSRVASLVGWSLERALKSAATDHADILLLGLWNSPPSQRILDAARRQRERGLVRHLAISCHHRPQIPNYAAMPDFDVLHVRYNAAHPGAETEVFPHLPPPGHRPGIVTFTATSWGQLLKSASATDCYRFALSHPDVNVCICGPSNDEQTEAALQALDAGPMSAEELANMRRIGQAVHG